MLSADAPVREEPGLLDDVADAAAQLVHVQRAEVAAVELDRAAGRLDQAVDHPQRRRLAAAGAAEQHGDLAARHLHREVADGDRPVRVALGDVVERDHGNGPSVWAVLGVIGKDASSPEETAP